MLTGTKRGLITILLEKTLKKEVNFAVAVVDSGKKADLKLALNENLQKHLRQERIWLLLSLLASSGLATSFRPPPHARWRSVRGADEK